MKRTWAVVLTAAALAASTACGSTGGSGDAAKQPAKPAAKSDEPAELTFYMTSNKIAEEAFNEKYGNKIREKFPKYTIKYIMQEDSKTLTNLITTGQTIDIMISSIGLTSAFLTDLNLQYDISELIKSNGYDLSKLEPTSVEIQRQIANGGMYGLPVSTSSGALFYNRDLFDKFGVSYPKDGMTWDDLYELAKKMTRKENGIQYKGLTMAFQHMLFLNQYSAEFVDPKTKKSRMTEEPFKKAILNYARFYQIPGNELPNNKFTLTTQSTPFLQNHTAAMYLTLNSPPKDEPASPNWDVVQAPSLAEKPGIGMQSYPNYFYLTSMSKNKQAAFNVMQYVTSEEYQQWMVANGSAFSSLKDPKMLDAYGKDAQYLKSRNVKSLLPKTFAPPTVKSAYQALADKEGYTALEEYLNGTDINTALRNASERLEKAIGAQQGK
jgi:multiple sugar transport system substrate-binding protein